MKNIKFRVLDKINMQEINIAFTNEEKYISLQFTGQYDIVKQEIYEKDIVWYTNEYGVIEWDNETSRYIINFNEWVTDFDHVYGKELEVVGNIYEDIEYVSWYKED